MVSGRGAGSQVNRSVNGCRGEIEEQGDVVAVSIHRAGKRSDGGERGLDYFSTNHFFLLSGV
ncbi:hypothetical protein Hanom_Chr08g00715041 [Helianthus anomalus]